MRKIIVVGSTNTDLILKVKKLPLPGETIIGGDFNMNLGGKGAIQAITSARMGSETMFICKVGSDIMGEKAIEQFQNEGIFTPFVFKDKILPSGVAIVFVDQEGASSVSMAPGANSSLSISDIKKAENVFNEGDILLIQMQIPLETIIYTIEMAYSRGLKIILNPAPALKLPIEIYKMLFAITPNETEIAILSGIMVSNPESLKMAAEVMLEKGIENIIVTLGLKGLFVKNKEIEQILTAPEVEPADVSAVGDVFNGAFASAIFNQQNLLDSLNFAINASAVSVSRNGSIDSIPKKKEVESFSGIK
jgi:ribokinase